MSSSCVKSYCEKFACRGVNSWNFSWSFVVSSWVSVSMLRVSRLWTAGGLGCWLGVWKFLHWLETRPIWLHLKHFRWVLWVSDFRSACWKFPGIDLGVPWNRKLALSIGRFIVLPMVMFLLCSISWMTNSVSKAASCASWKFFGLVADVRISSTYVVRWGCVGTSSHNRVLIR